MSKTSLCEHVKGPTGNLTPPPKKKNIEMTGTSDQPMESQLSIIGFDLIWKIQLTNLKFYFFLVFHCYIFLYQHQ